MTSNNRRTQPGRLAGETILLWIGLGVVIATVAAVYLAVKAGHAVAGLGPTPINPFDVFFGVLSGTIAWPTASTVILVVAAVILAGLAALAGVVLVRRRRSQSRVDHAARYLGRGRDIEPLTRQAAAATAERLNVASPGVVIAETVATGEKVYGSWEDTHVDIWGPRSGKTVSRAIPAILDAPGAVYVTSNKRDVVDATRDVRAALTGGRCWVFDPQTVALEEPSWWWNPLSYVTDEVKAAKLAEHFASGSRDPGARTDAFFDPAGQDLLAGLLLAAALDDRPITAVYSWLTRPSDDTSVTILNDHHYPLTADQVAGVITAPEKQRGGVFGTAQQMASCLTNRTVARWVTPQNGGHDSRPQFDPHGFVRSRDTLYSLSMEGKGTAGPLVTALTVAVTEAALDLAARSAGGRLPVPLLGVLDEAANVCRWRELPNLYSHFGSRGVVLMTILQSWSQGCEVWGEAGMRKLWSAANVKVYGGGVDEEQFLRHLSTTLGTYDQLTSTVSYGRGGHRTVSQQLHRDQILDVADLAALPKGRAIVLASGTRPTLARTLPWMTGPYADAVRRSIEAHDPQAGSTIADADLELARIVSGEDGRGSAPVLR